MKNIILFGGGNHASYCIDIIEQEGKYKILGILDSILEVGAIIHGYEVLGGIEDFKKIHESKNIFGGFISIGDNWNRKLVYDKIVNLKSDLLFVNAIHPSSTICKNVKMGVGNLIMAGSIIDTDAKIGNFVWFGSRALLEHGSIMHDFSSISSGSMTGGKVEIGKFSAITLGVTIVDRIKIGENSVIGSGSLVLKDVPDNMLAYGSPAKNIRERKPGEKFLK